MQPKNLLIEFMDRKKLSVSDVCRLTGRSKDTVYQWRSGVYPIPQHMMELLKLKIGSATNE